MDGRNIVDHAKLVLLHFFRVDDFAPFGEPQRLASNKIQGVPQLAAAISTLLFSDWPRALAQVFVTLRGLDSLVPEGVAVRISRGIEPLRSAYDWDVAKSVAKWRVDNDRVSDELNRLLATIQNKI